MTPPVGAGERAATASDGTVSLVRDHAPLLQLLLWSNLALGLIILWLPNEWATGAPIPQPVAVAFTLALLALSVFFATLPRRLGYALTPGGLQVSRFSGTQVWPYPSLEVVSTGGALGPKLGGVGVPGYYTGTYGWKGPEAKTVQALSSTTRGGVLLRRAGTLYYLTPADPAAFAEEIRRRLAVNNQSHI